MTGKTGLLRYDENILPDRRIKPRLVSNIVESN